jgi:hypothetical protein
MQFTVSGRRTGSRPISNCTSTWSTSAISEMVEKRSSRRTPRSTLSTQLFDFRADRRRAAATSCAGFASTPPVAQQAGRPRRFLPRCVRPAAPCPGSVASDGLPRNLVASRGAGLSPLRIRTCSRTGCAVPGPGDSYLDMQVAILVLRAQRHSRRRVTDLDLSGGEHGGRTALAAGHSASCRTTLRRPRVASHTRSVSDRDRYCAGRSARPFRAILRRTIGKNSPHRTCPKWTVGGLTRPIPFFSPRGICST